MSSMRQIRILGVRIDDVTEQEALVHIVDWIAADKPHQLVTVNPEFVIEARRNSAFQRVLAAADLATADGFGIMLAARWRRMPLRERVTGIGLSHRIAEHAAQKGWRIFLLGAAPGIAEQAAAVLEASYPGLHIVGCYPGSPHPEEEESIRSRIRAAKPHVLLVAYGHPAQDLWIARNQPLLRVPVAIGIGGSFDEIAGVVPSAPQWMQRLGLKWLYRLMTQPQRWRRIVNAVPVFLWELLHEQ